MSNEKTLLDGVAKENQSLAEMLGMEEKGASNNIAQMKKIAEQGNQSAITLLGIKYLTGDGVAKDIVEAMYWLEQSTASTAMHQVGKYYQENGEFTVAEKWFLKATEDKSFACQAYLSLVMLFVKTENLDLDKADQYLKEAFASSSNAEEDELLFKMGAMVGRMIGRSKPEKSIYWLKKALGHFEDIENRNALEHVYEKVVVTPESPSELVEEAVAYMEDKGDNVTASNAVSMFFYYQKIKNDKQKNLEWTKKAAETGYLLAQIQIAQGYLGEKYNKENALGLSLDLNECDYYLSMAEKNPNLAEKPDLQKICQSIRGVIQKENEEKKKQSEKHITVEMATEMLNATEKSGSTVLRIPEGYTHIDTCAFGISEYYAGKKNAYIKKITEIVFPESMREIGGGAFEGCCSLMKIVLPKKLEKLGPVAFDGTTKGFLGREVKDKRTLSELVIPGTTVVYAGSTWVDGASGLKGIHKIEKLIFEEGQKEINWNVFSEVKIDYLYIPNSVVKLPHCEVPMQYLDIKRISAPSHLQSELSKVPQRLKVEWR